MQDTMSYPAHRGWSRGQMKKVQVKVSELRKAQIHRTADLMKQIRDRPVMAVNRTARKTIRVVIRKILKKAPETSPETSPETATNGLIDAFFNGEAQIAFAKQWHKMVIYEIRKYREQMMYAPPETPVSKLIRCTTQLDQPYYPDDDGE